LTIIEDTLCQQAESTKEKNLIVVTIVVIGICFSWAKRLMSSTLASEIHFPAEFTYNSPEQANQCLHDYYRNTAKSPVLNQHCSEYILSQKSVESGKDN